jgi:hypothetical protein
VLQNFQIPLGRGVNVRDLPELLEDGQAVETRNFVALGRSRIGPRKADRLVSGGYPGRVVAIVPFPVGYYPVDAPGNTQRGGIVLVYEASSGITRLYDVNLRGEAPLLRGTLWTGRTNEPPVVSAARLDKRVFLCEESRQHALTIYDHTGVLSAPTFDLVGDEAAFIPMKPRTLVQHANMLFVAGHGAPDTVRYSYLGLVSDDSDPDIVLDAGDANSLGLFSREDRFSLTEAGVPVIGMQPAAGRLVLATPYELHLLFGTDRESFQASLLDNDRGCVSSRAMIAAAGSVWGWSAKHGPWRYDGQLRDLGYPILPLLAQVNTDTLFAAHAPDAREVRWYSDTVRLAYNYEIQEWFTHPSATEYWCAGRISPFWSSGAPDDGGRSEISGPAAAPSALTASGISQAQATLSWTNGDTAPGTETEVERRLAGGAWAQVAKVEAGTSSFGLAGLSPGTAYEARVRHRRSGVASGYASTTFSTASATAPPNTPTNLVAYDDPLAGNPGIALSWRLSNPGVQTEIQRKTSISNYAQIATTAPEQTWFRDWTAMTDVTYTYRVRAINEFGASGFSNEATETATGNAP